MKSTLSKAVYGLAVILILTSLAGPIIAAERRASTLEEVVVTARRQAESLQTTPVAVTAIGQKTLGLKQIIDIADIQRTTPNLGITQGATAGSKFVFVTLRGQQNLQAGVGNDPAVGIYVDGVYMARPSTGVMDLSDVARVEVLRGPQGTLFGRNTIGGAVSVTANPPSDVFEGSLAIDIAEYDTRNISGMINVPIADDLAVRVSGHHKSHDGYGENVTLAQDAADLDRDDFVRMSLRYRVNERWDMRFTADWNEVEDSGVLNGLAAWHDPTGLLGATGISLDPYLHGSSNWYKSYGGEETAVDADYTPFDNVRSYGYGLEVNGDTPWGEFTSITAWRSSFTESFQDLDATPVDILNVLSAFQAENISQEFQLSGGAGKLSWTGGVFYFREVGQEFSESQSFGFLGSHFNENFADVENVSYAAYLQTYYDLTSKLRAVAGFRYTWDERNAVLHHTDRVDDPTTCNVPFPDDGMFPPCNQTLEEDFDYPAWLLGLDYQLTPDLFMYAKSSGASMAGGWNLRFGSVPAYEPQNVIDIEFGLKADWLDGRLRTNLAVFHMWQTDVQRNVSTVVDGRTTQYVRNAGDAQISGIEFEGTLLPWQGMELTAAFGLMKGDYDDGTYSENQAVTRAAGPILAGCSSLGPGAAPGTASYACRVDRSGEELLQLPEFTFNIGVTQTWPLDFGELGLHVDYAYIDDQTFFEQTPSRHQPDAVKAVFAQANDLGRLDGYGLLNASATLELTRPAVTVSLWARNLADKEYVQMNFAELYGGLGTSLDYVGEPRVVGVTVSYRFSE